MLNISPEKVCFIMVKAREFDAKVAPLEAEAGSNPADDSERNILEDFEDDPTFEELVGSLEVLSDDEMAELVALTWLGQGDYGSDEWEQALAEAQDMSRRDAIRHLTGIPLLSDYLEEGLSAFGYSCEEYEMGRL